jgi:hypothetical protein
VNSLEVGCRTECCAERSGSNVDRPSATTSVIRDGCDPDANRVRRWPIVGSNWMAVRGRQRPSWPPDDAVTAPESPAADNSGDRWDRSSSLRPEEPSSCDNLRRTNKTVTRLLSIRPDAAVSARREINAVDRTTRTIEPSMQMRFICRQSLNNRPIPDRSASRNPIKFCRP